MKGARNVYFEVQISPLNCDAVFLQSSVKINQISLDESGEHVGVCSEDGKVRSVHSSGLVTDPRVLQLHISSFHLNS